MLVVAAIVLWPRADGVSYRNYQRIEMGMSREQVYAILDPPGDYTTGPMTAWFGMAGWGDPPPHSVRELWDGHIGILDVYFTPEGVVAAKEYRWHGPKDFDPASLIRRLVDDLVTGHRFPWMILGRHRLSTQISLSIWRLRADRPV
jgi:hypothetical protein